jgi:hypothetical protein
MKKAILFFISVLFVWNGFSQNVNHGGSVNYNIQVQVVDSARTFTVNYPNGEEFRKLLMLTWGRPVVITAGSIEWTPVTLQDIGDNLKITLRDGVETTEGATVVFKTFVDDNAKFNMLNDLQSNQKRKMTIVFANQQGINVVSSKSIENAVVKAIDQIVTSAR